MDTSPSLGTSCTGFVCLVFLLLAGCNATTEATPSAIVQDIGALIAQGDAVQGARHLWSLAEPHVDVAVAGVEKLADDATGLVDTVSGIADSTLGQSVTASRIGIDSGYREGAVAGALAGSVVGLLSGPWVLGDRKSFLATRTSLDEEIAFQQEVALSLDRDMVTAQAVLAQHRRDIAGLRQAREESTAEIRASEGTRARIRADRRALRALIARAQRSVVVLDERLASFLEAGLDTSSLEPLGEERQRALGNLRAIENALVDLVTGTSIAPGQPDHRSGAN